MSLQGHHKAQVARTEVRIYQPSQMRFAFVVGLLVRSVDFDYEHNLEKQLDGDIAWWQSLACQQHNEGNGMNESKFTPGPWRAHKTEWSRSGLPEYQIHWSPHGECVAEVVHGDGNAHLVAAAPELLEALEEMVRECGMRGGCRDEILPASYQNELIARAMQVIAKSKGEA